MYREEVTWVCSSRSHLGSTQENRMMNTIICTKEDSTRTKKVNSRRPRTLSQDRNEEMARVRYLNCLVHPKLHKAIHFRKEAKVGRA
jgi:hypothetical protein